MFLSTYGRILLQLKDRVKGVIEVLCAVSRTWPWKEVWKEEPADVRLRAVFFIARCLQWAKDLEIKFKFKFDLELYDD